LKDYVKMCAENFSKRKKIQVSILAQIIKWTTESGEPLHELVQKGIRDPSKMPGGGNKRFEFRKN
jgi:hypothetical protein